jgi:hypothetical protein
MRAASGLSRYSGEYLNRPFIDADNKAFYEKRGGVSGNAKPDT